MNKYKKGSAHLIVLVVVFLAIVGSLGYAFWSNYSSIQDSNTNNANNSSTEDSNATNNTIPTDETDDISTEDGVVNLSGKDSYEIIATIYYALLGKYSSDSTIEFEKGETVQYGSGPFYTLENYDYYTLAAHGSFLDISQTMESDWDKWNQTIEPIYADIASYFLNDSDFTKSDSSIFYTNVFYNQNTVCGYPNADSGMPFRLSCAEISDYMTVAQTAEPLVQAYRLSRGTTADIYFGVPTISGEYNSNGYRHATMSTSNAMGLFYQKNGEDWKYFTSTQAALPCEDYNTDELRAAYQGESCYDNSLGSESVVN